MTGHRPIRVAIVAPTLAIMGGHSVQAQHLVEGWSGDAEVTAALVPTNPAFPRALAWLSRVKYVRTAVTQLLYWPALVRCVPRADIVHLFAASNSSFFVTVLPAAIVARLCRRRTIVHYHGDGPAHLDTSPLARAVLRAASDRVAPSTYFGDILARHGLQARVIPNIVDVGRFRFRAREPLRPRLLSTRSFEPLYNVACTLRAFGRVQTRYPDASLTLVGDGSERAALRELAGRLRLRNVVFAGRVAPAEMPQYYDAADIYLQTPRIDNMPGSVLEAFASGTPVVSTRVGGIPAMLHHEVHGVLVDDDDDEQVAEGVISLLERPAHAQALAKAALTICRECEWPAVRERWLPTYRSAIHEGHAMNNGRRTALITGASSGIGEAFADVFASEGFDLVITARREERLRAVADRIAREYGVSVHAIPCDLADRSGPAALCAEISRRGVSVDALVNSAGFGAPGAYLDAPWPVQDAMLQVMVVAVSDLTRRLLPGMIARRYGRIVNVASTAGLVPTPAGTLYGAAKTFVVRFSRSLAREVAAHGVHVTAVCPGLTRSEFHAAAGARASVEGMPGWLWMDASAVARQGVSAVMAGKPVCVNGAINRAQVALFRVVPLAVVSAIGKRVLGICRRLTYSFSSPSGSTTTKSASSQVKEGCLRRSEPRRSDGTLDSAGFRRSPKRRSHVTLTGRPSA